MQPNYKLKKLTTKPISEHVD